MKGKQVEIGGIVMTVQSKKIKRLYIRVLPPDGKVEISAPTKVSDDELTRIIENKLQWIVEKREAVILRHRDENERFFLWGTEYAIIPESGKRRGATRIEGENIAVNEGKGGSLTADELTAALNSFYRAQLSDAMHALIPECERAAGVSAHEWRIKSMKTKWGTCNINERRIWLSLSLAKYPKDALKAVMIHELTHLLFKNHDSHFYAHMDKSFPDWKNARSLLDRRL